MLHVVDTLRPGGKERLVVDFANGLDAERFHVAVCATREGGPLENQLAPGVNLITLNRTRRWQGLGAFRSLLHTVRPHVVHSHGAGSGALVGLFRAARLLEVPHVWHDHRSDLPARPSAGRERLARMGVDAYVGVSPANCEWATDVLGLPPERVHLITNAVDLERFWAASPSLREGLGGLDRVLLVIVAGFRPEKDHPMLFRAVSECQTRGSFRLLVVGPQFEVFADYLAECRSLIDRLGLGEDVSMLGAREDVPTILASVDGGLLASRRESGPLALAEYMAAGLPYVVTSTGELTAQVEGSGTGFIVPPADAAAMAAAIDRLVRMPAQARRELGARGRFLAEELFDCKRAVSAVASLYAALIDRKKGPVDLHSGLGFTEDPR